MTASKTKDGFEFCCDSCGEIIDPPKLGRGSEPRDFHESWADAKAKGWRAVKDSRGEWCHECPTCC